MLSEEVLKQFFDEHFKKSSGLFLYKDKQLLKQKDYSGFAEHQLKKSRTIFRGAMLASVGLFTFGLLYFFAYMTAPKADSFNLYISFAYIIGALTSLTFSVKEHYSIKTSMNLLLMILDAEKATEPDGVQVLESQ
ncbi:hypothetical protein DYD21_04475 [Rhodohalobacter sp. SW132]|uniref:hypothetical protein n=1 Tax=Rhodohalobacter sp. SW132 TaxID=2293433 RepID=UPI000E23D009|nr:hypothetical protein [Rhodohalobacter sp. SW132]REL39215.1 hypothetical protein DYD21_04475 [Rhodohalobacter sp. SW132]